MILKKCLSLQVFRKNMKALVRFFRKKAINAYRKTKKTCVLPDVSKHPAVAVIIDETELSRGKELITALNGNFAMRKCTIFAKVNTVPYDVVYGETVHFITKNDIGMFGLLNDDAKSVLSAVSYDMLINLCNPEDEVMTGNYLMTLINTTFRVSFDKSNQSLYDLVIETKKEDVIAKLTVLSRYLTMLTGKNNEK